MKKIYKPTMYYKDIFTINYELLKNKKIKYLLFDIDNTIAKTIDKAPSKDVIALFDRLKKEGFTILILTNAIPMRARAFAKKLNVKAYSLSWKPLSRNYKRIIKSNHLSSDNIAAIGDQIYTDIKGANKMKIASILVDQISKKESVFTKINRIKENKLIKKYKIIKRGEYYE